MGVERRGRLFRIGQNPPSRGRLDVQPGERQADRPRRDMQDWKDLLAEAGVRGLGCTTPATQQRP